MTFKTITIKESVYKGILSRKPSNESFSEFFERTIVHSGKPNLQSLYDAWNFTPDEEKKLDETLHQMRTSATV